MIQVPISCRNMKGVSYLKMHYMSQNDKELNSHVQQEATRRPWVADAAQWHGRRRGTLLNIVRYIQQLLKQWLKILYSLQMLLGTCKKIIPFFSLSFWDVNVLLALAETHCTYLQKVLRGWNPRLHETVDHCNNPTWKVMKKYTCRVCTV